MLDGDQPPTASDLDPGLRARQAAGGPSSRRQASDAHGTTITFQPDDEIFDELEFDYATLAERLRETAFLTRGLKIELVDERGHRSRATPSTTMAA